MDEIEFITWEELLNGHVDQLRRYGGRDGFVDENTVRAAMARPQFKAKYEEDADLADLAAAYLYALSTTQGFVDGNKRSGVVASTVFLRKNGWKPTISDEIMYIISIAVSCAQVDEEMLARIFRDNIEPLDDAESDV
jgi:death on curing protein